MGLGRKGIFLSLSAILLIGVLFVVFAPATQRELSQDSRLQVEETIARVQALETSELEVWLDFTTRQTLNTLARQVGTSSPFGSVQDLQEAFSGCVMQSECIATGADNRPRPPQETLGEIQQFYQQRLGYEQASIQLVEISLEPASFRTVLVRAQFDILFVDEANRMRIDRQLNVERLVSIEGLIDPLALRAGAPRNRIVFNTGIIQTVDEFFEHANQQTYVVTGTEYPGIPFLDRFTANPTPRRDNSLHFVFPPGHYTAQQSSIDYNYNRDTAESCMLILRDPDSNQVVYLDADFGPFYGLVDLENQQATDGCQDAQ